MSLLSTVCQLDMIILVITIPPVLVEFCHCFLVNISFNYILNTTAGTSDKRYGLHSTGIMVFKAIRCTTGSYFWKIDVLISWLHYFLIAVFSYGVSLSPRSAKLSMCTLEVMNVRVNTSTTG